MRKNLITSIVVSVALLTLGGSIKILNALDTLVMEEMVLPAPISLKINDVDFNIDQSEFTKSQYCSKDGAFTFFFTSTFPHAFTLRMVLESDEPFRLNHRYEIPYEHDGTLSAVLQDYNFRKEDDHATSGWIEFTKFEKEGGILTRNGEVMCSIEGRFGFTVSDTGCPDKNMQITEGTFRIPEAQYCDLRTIK